MAHASDDKFTPEQMKEVERLRADHGFIGHPKAIGTLSIMQLCNGVGSSVVNAILIYFLIKKSPVGLGFSDSDASQLMSLFSTLLLLCGIVGSYVADRILGPRTSLRCARLASLVGYTMLALPFLGVYGYVGSQIVLCLGSMVAGRSTEALASKMYRKGDERSTAAFSMLYMLSNVAGIFAPIIVGTIADVFGYYASFAVAAVFALVALGVYVLTEKKFFGPVGLNPDDPVPPAKRNAFVLRLVLIIVVVLAIIGVLFATGVLSVKTFSNYVSTAAIFIPVVYFIYIFKSKKTSRAEARRLLGLIPLFLCNIFAMWVWTQCISILAVYTDKGVNRMFLGFEITPAAFQTWGCILAVSFGALTTLLWTKLGDRQPKAPTKLGLGTLLWAAGPAFMAIPFALNQGGKDSPLWLLIFWVLIMLGEAITSPAGYAAAAEVAPVAFTTQMMTVWSMSQSTGAALNTLSVNFYHEGGEVPYFLAIGGTTALLGVLVLVFSKKISGVMGLE